MAVPDKPIKNEATKRDTGVITADRQKTKEPPLFRVILLNDHYTAMDFVVQVLEQVFRKDPAEAQEIMLNVHSNGKGIAGVYTREIAETKIAIVHHLARQHEFPLKCTMEEA
ncbi:ATP-dependent Clp protease adapter ClpS [bacterium]|nr:ATP-dependent Clp protease adapter ClpS [bacterium]